MINLGKSFGSLKKGFSENSCGKLGRIKMESGYIEVM
jgi:hypothetical protein